MMKNFNQLYEEYADDVFRFALYLCGSVQWAEDLTSEAFVRALTRRDALRMPTVKAYLLTIVRNLYRKQFQREGRFAQLGEHHPDGALGPEASAEQQAELAAVLRSMQMLDEVDRVALLMRVLYDMPYQEIAATLGLSLSAVRVKVHRARLKLVAFREQENKND
jgi:RNA polymerase sigma-70 factor (ECF subfamily)